MPCRQEVSISSCGCRCCCRHPQTAGSIEQRIGSLHAFQSNLLLLHPFYSLFSRITWVGRYQKGKTSLDLKKARHGGVLEWQWHQLDLVQTICTSLKTDKYSNTSLLNFAGWMLFLMPDHQCRSTEGSGKFFLKITKRFHYRIKM